jgi:hypothetical protein
MLRRYSAMSLRNSRSDLLRDVSLFAGHFSAVPWFSFQREIVDRAVLSLKDAGVRIALVGPTAADARDVMVEGEGIGASDCRPPATSSH